MARLLLGALACVAVVSAAGPSALMAPTSKPEASALRSGVKTSWAIRPLEGVDRAEAINDRGQVAGLTYRRKPFAERAVLWVDGRVLDLGTLGGSESGVYYASDAINNRGQVIGYSSYRRCCHDRGFLWANGRMRDLGAFAGGDSYVVAINEQGQVTGTSSNARHSRAFIWYRGKMRDLGGQQVGLTPFSVEAINDRGQIIGDSTFNAPTNPSRAFLWANGNMRDLGTLGGRESQVRAMNNRGQVIGWADTSAKQPDGSPIQHAFLWQNGTMRDLGSWVDLDAINERAQVIGSLGLTRCRSRAALWQNGHVRDLGTLPDDRYSDAAAINDRGQVVGISYRDCSGYGSRGRPIGTRPFVWENGEMIPLPAAPARQIDVIAINNQGLIIGQTPAASFLWTPTTALSP